MLSQNGESPEAGGPGALEKTENALFKTDIRAGVDCQLPPVHRAAIAYYRARLSVVPASSRTKHPTIAWTRARKEPLNPARVQHWPGDGVFVVTGHISGNLEVMDFDDKGSRYAAWCAGVEAEAPGLLARLVVERSPSGGKHVFYRCPDVVVPKGAKLARKATEDRKDCLIELRGEGDGCVIYPSPGYEILQGRISCIPSISRDERGALLIAALRLNEKVPGNVVRWRGAR